MSSNILRILPTVGNALGSIVAASYPDGKGWVEGSNAFLNNRVRAMSGPLEEGTEITPNAVFVFPCKFADVLFWRCIRTRNPIGSYAGKYANRR